MCALQWGLNEHKPVVAEQVIGTCGHGLLVLLSPVQVSSEAGKLRVPSGLRSNFMICLSMSVLTLLFWLNKFVVMTSWDCKAVTEA